MSPHFLLFAEAENKIPKGLAVIVLKGFHDQQPQVSSGHPSGMTGHKKMEGEQFMSAPLRIGANRSMFTK